MYNNVRRTVIYLLTHTKSMTQQKVEHQITKPYQPVEVRFWKQRVELWPSPASDSAVSDAARLWYADTRLDQQHNYTDISSVYHLHRRKATI
jgi:hypothetical protein